MLDWITLSKNSGSDNDTISVEAQPNAQRYCREGTITVTSGNGSISKQVKILQYGAATYRLEATFVGVPDGAMYKITGCVFNLSTEDAEEEAVTYSVSVELLNNGTPFELPDGSSTINVAVSFDKGATMSFGQSVFNTPFKIANKEHIVYHTIQATSTNGTVWVDKNSSTISYRDATLYVDPEVINVGSSESTTSVYVGISDGDKWTAE